MVQQSQALQRGGLWERHVHSRREASAVRFGHFGEDIKAAGENSRNNESYQRSRKRDLGGKTKTY